MLPPPEQPLPDLALGAHGRPGRGHRRALRDRRRRDRGPGRPARRLLARHRRGARAGDGRPTVAVLVRARKQLPRHRHCAARARLPVEVVGLGGLLEVPEVSDVVATLTVLVDPTAGDALGRLLTGARWRIGPRDLAALKARARALVHSRRPAPAATGARSPEARRPSAAASSRRSTTSAARRLLGRRATVGCAGSAPSWAHLRTRLSEPLPDLVDEVARPSAWRPSWPARPGQPGRRPRPPRRAARGRRRVHRARRAALPAGVPRLPRDAEEHERGLEPGEVAVNPEAVQLLTGHSAKGLEWDVVAVPGITLGQFPSEAPTPATRGSPTPVPCRPTCAHRPGGPARGSCCRCPGRATRPWSSRPQGLRPGLEGRRHEEEVRLGYVAVTRARHLLVCSGSWWRDGKKPCGPSSLLETARAASRAAPAPSCTGPSRRPTTRTNPALAEWPVGIWPADPLSSGRRRALRAAADLVALGAAPARPGAAPRRRRPQVAQWVRDADLLLRERARAAEVDRRRPLPSHLSVSALVTLRRDPASWPGGCAGRCRRSRAAGRRGTAFHAWLEERFGAAQLLDLDELPGSGDEAAAPDSAAGRAAGGLPRQRVGRPPAGRGRGAVRDAARPADAARPDRRRVRRRRRAATRSSTGRPARRRPGPSSRRRRAAGRLPAGLVPPDRRAGGAGQRRVPPRRRERQTVRPVDLLDEAGCWRWSPARP